MDVQQADIDSVIPYARNPRKNEKAVDKVAASIKEFGFRQPIVVDSEKVVIAGHTRLEAAKKLNLSQVPIHIAEGLTEAQVKAYRLADNRVSQEAEWDIDLLKLELSELDDIFTGFDEDEIANLLQETTEGLTDEDEVPEIPEEPVSKLGDVWILGNHRLMCGDSTSIDAVDTLLAGVKPHLMVTDPPYGVEYDPSWRADAGVNKNKEKMGKVENDGNADWSDAWALFPGNIAYVWHADRHASVVQKSLEDNGFKIRNQIIWAKDRFALSRGDYHWQHEPCWYAVRGTGNWVGDRSQSTLWNISSRDDKGHGHGTQKPVECMRRPILNNSSPGQAIYEPFSGSGTTIIAAESEGRSCLAMELSPNYVDVTVKRWQNFTGKEAILESTNKTYNELETEREAA